MDIPLMKLEVLYCYKSSSSTDHQFKPIERHFSVRLCRQNIQGLGDHDTIDHIIRPIDLTNMNVGNEKASWTILQARLLIMVLNVILKKNV